MIVGILLWPAEATVRTWGKKQLAERTPGSIMHGAGEVIVTVLP